MNSSERPSARAMKPMLKARPPSSSLPVSSTTLSMASTPMPTSMPAMEPVASSDTTLRRRRTSP